MINVVSFSGLRTTEGKVINNIASPGSSIVSISVVEYRVEGEVETTQIDSRYGKRGWNLHKIGDVVDIAYDPKNPSEAKELNIVIVYLIPAILAFSGVFTVMVFWWLKKQIESQAAAQNG